MKILLLGKFPPLQGGISAKTYWLYKNLKKKGFDFQVITINDDHYSIKNSDLNELGVNVVNNKQIPWHIPETKLLDDRLLNIALKVAKNFNPDLVETNYLWPFCEVALFLSHILKKPFLIRHAGSDIIKFYKDKEFSEIISFYFSQASLVATNITSNDLIEKACGEFKNKYCLKRYIPDSKIFKPDNTVKKFDILFAGKVNYHWNLKGLSLLLEIIRQKKLNALFLIGGNYKNKLQELISINELEKYIQTIDFLSPEKMPSIYNSCNFVWCWEEEGIIEDFSNIIWEAVFCNIPCILNSQTSQKVIKEGGLKNFDNLLYGMDTNHLLNFRFDPKRAPVIDNYGHKTSLFQNYIQENINLYKRLV